MVSSDSPIERSTLLSKMREQRSRRKARSVTRGEVIEAAAHLRGAPRVGVLEQASAERRETRAEDHREVELIRAGHDAVRETVCGLVDHDQHETVDDLLLRERRVVRGRGAEGRVGFLRGTTALRSLVHVEAGAALAAELAGGDESLVPRRRHALREGRLED